MSRQAMLLGGLAALLVVALFWFLLYQPALDEEARILDEAAAAEAQQAQLRLRIAELRAVRDDAPRLQEYLAAAESIIPSTAGLPAMLRQLQTAADDAGVTLQSVTPARPVAVEGEAVAAAGELGQLSRISLSLQVDGSYFQIVDFLRRVENPEIVPRAILWTTVSVGESDEGLPELSASLGAEMYALLPVAEAEPEPTDEEAGDDAEPDKSPASSESPTEEAT